MQAGCDDGLTCAAPSTASVDVAVRIPAGTIMIRGGADIQVEEAAMAATRRNDGRLSDEQLAELIGLLGDVDSVELKLSVPEADERAVVSAFRLDPLDAEIRQVFFFDTPELALNRAGVVVRARRVQRKGDDSVVKLRPVVPSRLPEVLRRSAGFGVEVDAMPGGFVCSASMKGTPSGVRAATYGEKPVRKLFSKEQRAFYRAHAPEGLELDDLAILGPIFVLKLKFSPKGLERRMVAEMWLYPDGSRVFELSTKCAPAEAFQVAAEARAYLAANGVHLGAEQETKTKKALQYFSRRLATQREPVAPDPVA